MPRKADPRPMCECGDCRGPERPHLPMAAWKIAGGGGSQDGGQVAVAPGHELRHGIRGERLEYHRGWVAVGEPVTIELPEVRLG